MGVGWNLVVAEVALVHVTHWVRPAAVSCGQTGKRGGEVNTRNSAMPPPKRKVHNADLTVLLAVAVFTLVALSSGPNMGSAAVRHALGV